MTVRILVAPDSFKGTLSSGEAARSICAGVSRALPSSELVACPLADGGEGSLNVVLSSLGDRATTTTLAVEGPHGDCVPASIGFMVRERVALVESAEVVGLGLLAEAHRDPKTTSSRGVGQLIHAALRLRPNRIVIFLGGSSTCDGGAGAAEVLGFRLDDALGQPIGRGGLSLLGLASITRPRTSHIPPECDIVAAVDVLGPLLGPRGAALMYSPQKGASSEDAHRLEFAMSTLVSRLRIDLGADISGVLGGVAAGGLGAGLVAFAAARIVSGANMIMDLVGFQKKLHTADLVLTGEGSLDEQTPDGKLVSQVIAAARRSHVPVVVIAGRIRSGWESLAGEDVFAYAVNEWDPGTDPASALEGAVTSAARRYASSWLGAG
jgi:glycerate kinase